jgi:hypothetical protein
MADMREVMKKRRRDRIRSYKLEHKLRHDEIWSIE